MEYILRTNTVSKKYTNYYAVDKVSISIKKGEIYGLIGENGAGKSTLMKMIAGLVEPSEGSIELFGNFVPQTERYRIGCVIESPALYAELTAKQNLEVFRKAYGLSSKESVQQILKQVCLSQYESYDIGRCFALLAGCRRRRNSDAGRCHAESKGLH